MLHPSNTAATPRGLTRAAALLACLPISALHAQQAGPPADAAPSWNVNLGAGALAVPRYPGASRMRVLPVPAFDVSYGDIFAANFQDGVTLRVLNAGGFSAGPMVRVGLGRKVSDDRARLEGLGDIGESIELGGYAAYQLGNLRLRATATQDVAHGHRGLTGTLEASYFITLRDSAAGPWLLAAGPQLSLANHRYNQAFFGVTPSQSALSGLPQYRAGGGVQGAGLEVFMDVPVTSRISVSVLGNYTRLVGDAAKSPLVDHGRGDPNQFVAGLFATYRFF